MPKLTVKWSGKVFDVDVDFNEPPAVFKFQLFSLSGVPPERQKIMVKGGMLKDDADWSTLGLKEGSTLMMMGSAEQIPEAPKEQVKFVEDMTSTELQANIVAGLPAHVKNLGNTCYLNAVLGLLRHIPEFCAGLKKYTGPSLGMHDQGHNLAIAMRDLISELDGSVESVTPFRLVHTVRSVFPQFSQQTPQGHFMQQDAEECWTQCLSLLAQKMVENQSGDSANKRKNTIDQLFGIDLRTTLKNEESAEEGSSETSESVQKLSLHPQQESRLFFECIRKSLEGELVKRSETLGRDAKFKKMQRIARLPSYLVVQFVRFEWRPETKTRCKILREVAVPQVLDMFDFCTDDLKDRLKPVRESLRIKEEEELRLRKAQKTSPDGGPSSSNAGNGATEAAPVIGLAAATAAAAAKKHAEESKRLKEPVGECETGRYELVGVLTHMGRAADGGHYVAWAKEAADSWIKYDDDKVSLVKDEDIRKLNGGYGDWHIAYLCLYRAKNS
eukprot:tig00020554_g10934.t1